MAESHEGISKLTSLGPKLNQTIDEFNKIIASIEKKLADAGIGLEVWVEDDPVESGDSYSDFLSTDRDQEDPIPTRDVTLLGYARINDKWVLAVKSATLTTKDDHRGGEYEAVTGSSELRPLLNASREIRARSMRLIPRLLGVLTDEAEQALRSMDAAKKVAAEL